MGPPASSPTPWGRSSTRASRDWAQHGHVDSAERLNVVFEARPNASVTGTSPSTRFSQHTRRAVGTIALVVVALGSAGSAFALRDALFPETGDATTRSVWLNPGIDTTSNGYSSVTSPSDSRSRRVAPDADNTTTTTIEPLSGVENADVPGSEVLGSGDKPFSDTPSRGTVALTPTVSIDADNDNDSSGSGSGTTPASGTIDNSDDDADHKNEGAGGEATTTSSPEESERSSPSTTDVDVDVDVDDDDDDDSSGHGSGGGDPSEDPDDSENSGPGSSNSGSGSSGP